MGDIKKSSPLFIAYFEDGTKFEGGKSYFDTQWLHLPNKQIKTLLYRLPDGNYLCLSGGEKYFHMVEATKDWATVNCKGVKPIKDSKPRLENDYIMMRIKDKVISYRIALYAPNRLKELNYYVNLLSQVKEKVEKYNNNKNLKYIKYYNIRELRETFAGLVTKYTDCFFSNKDLKKIKNSVKPLVKAMKENCVIQGGSLETLSQTLYSVKKILINEITKRQKTGNITDAKYRVGDITRREYNINDEKIKKLDRNNWR